MISASEEGRDAVAEGLVWLFGWVADFFALVFGNLGIATIVLAVLVGLALVRRLSLALGPEKRCWRCKGNGWVGGLLGGRRECGSCAGRGRRPRIGAGGRR